jgi:alkanesulfonate monooxygenase SsuD/methylene tetrahydromethanopterin reductase-like flavin-dependent oxidoreductase (luciferase family)
MGDYGRAIEFGYFLVPNAADPLLKRAQTADRLGLDLIGVQDHPYQKGYVETWTLLSVLTAGTERVRLFPDVANLPLRNPSVLAKSAATLNLLSGGRAELGLGAGAFWDAIEAYGGSRRTPREALEALEEAVEIIRLIWSGRPGLHFDGKHYRLNGAKGGPVPTRPMEIWLGVGGPRALALTGRLADGWLPSSGWAFPDRLPELNARIDDAAVAAGRRPDEIRRLYNVKFDHGRTVEGFPAGPRRSMGGRVDRPRSRVRDGHIRVLG